MDNKDMPAFPLKLKDGEKFDGIGNLDGFSKREEVAKAAMQGLLSCYDAQVDMQRDSRYNAQTLKKWSP